MHPESGLEASCNIGVATDTISELEAVVCAPTPDALPDLSINIPDEVDYSAKIEYWCSSDDINVMLSELDAFEDGKTYSVCVKFTANDGCMFEENPTVMINGKKAEIISEDLTEIVVSMEFVCSKNADTTFGDVTGDFKVTMEDVVMLQKYIADLIIFSDKQKAAADVTHDDDITMLDVTSIQKFIAELIDKF